MEEPKFANVWWAIEDVMGHYDITEEQAHEFLASIEKWLERGMIEKGWDILHQHAHIDKLTNKPLKPLKGVK
jgi:hypothetical protein